MGVQTTIQQDPNIAYEGMVSESNPFGLDIITKIVQTATGVSAGRFCAQGTADNQCVLPGASTDITGPAALGFAIYDPSKPTNWPPSATTVAYPQGQACPLLRKGRIWVVTEQAVTPADPVYVRYAAGSFSVLGRVRKDADTASAAALGTGVAKFCTTQATIGGLVLVEINLI
ncbi:MAG TPA: hypothetical protein VLT45_12860 [Kofleriaceae bacterium]|nr:hypothetical protein [Kofleriaceae bacterium]